MKRKLSLLSVVFVMAMGTYFATNGTTSQKNDLLTQNIEALSGGEDFMDIRMWNIDCENSSTWKCTPNGKNACPRP